MFEIEMLPAREGDCLWLRYGNSANPRQLLIDGGRSATYKELRARLQKLPAEHRNFELLIITHVDRDHIEGAMDLLEDAKLPATFKQIWFNGFDHLKSAELETFGAVQGERVTKALLKRKKEWNSKWGGKAVVLSSGALPEITLEGGMTLTLLSPDREKLTELIPTWVKECKEAGIVPGSKPKKEKVEGLEDFGGLNIDALAASKFVADETKPNGTSIALIADYQGTRVLFGADAHVDRLLASLKLAAGIQKKVKLDAYKVAHHGSERNVSRELLELIDCPTYLISTNGSYFHHPKAVSLARIIKFGAPKTIAFNYRSKFTNVWDKASLKTKYGYQAVYPLKQQNGTLTVTIAP